ncbi:unnamed protein product [Merluccius merluccius]
MAALGRMGRRCRSLLPGSTEGLLCDLRKLGRMDRTIGRSYVDVFHRKLQRNELILKDELMLLLHVCQSVDDVATARDAVHRYHEENKNFTYDFKFGPLFMRLCYELGLEEMAAATLTDKNLRGFFSDRTSFNIAIDMLFTKGCYEDALEVLSEMKSQGVPFNKDTYMLACGICYKLNTPESFRICVGLTEQVQTETHIISRQTYCFAVALALQQNDTEKAQSLFSQIMNTDNTICQNLKVVMLAMSGAVTEAILVLSLAVSAKTPPLVKKLKFAQEVIERLRLQSEDGPHAVRLEQMVSALQNSGQVTHQSLDEMLCHTPPARKKKSFSMGTNRSVNRRTLRPLQATLLSE